MGPNNAELVRVFTRQTDALIADITFPSHLAFEAVKTWLLESLSL